ncbi:MAG: carboxypeptidase M32 [Deltaproteobacteria bacterium]|nr:carboxypeptidase M32 [Deltaproteobacteria bacterium]
MTAYRDLVASFTKLHRYQHLSSIVQWDQAAMMPANGNEARSAAMAELAVLLHETLTAPHLAAALEAAMRETSDPVEVASVREMRRQWRSANLLPSSLVEAKSLAGTRCEHAWRTQRQANDWAGFLANWKPVVACVRQEAALLAEATGLSKYDALVDRFEPGMTSAVIEPMFADLKRWLPPLIREVTAAQAKERVVAPVGPFPVAAQRALGVEVMGLLGFDFDGGRLDVSTHPFCGGVPEDVRITTRYRDDDFVQAMMGIVHETGHARYEQRLPRAWVHLPLGQARSMGIHESQSLSFEMQLGRSRPFLALIAPLVKQHLGDQPAFDADNLARIYTRVRTGFIRVDADELTYPMHVILRFEIERAIVEGELEPEDVPAVWDEKMRAYLGLDTRGNYRDGCLQDIHWTDGAFGYFPSYTLGAMYAAQYFAAIRAAVPDLDARIAAGDLAPIFAWLDERIWSQASRWETRELVERATGAPLSPAHFERHLRARYLP